MKCLMKLHLLQLLIFLLKIFFTKSVSQETPVITYCGKIKIQKPFLPSDSSLLSQMILCKSEKLFFRTSIGLFPISSINYTDKILTVSDSSCTSPASNFVSPHLLSAGFPTRSNPNSLLLFNCSNYKHSKNIALPCNYNNISQLNGCFDSSSSCLMVDDVGSLGRNFHPKEMNCTHYSRVYKNSMERFKTGTKISFEVDHVPNPCNECKKPYGNCGAGLRCICHPKLCEDKVFSVGAVLKPCGNVLIFCLLFLVIELKVIREV